MDETSRAAFIFSQSVMLLARLAELETANAERLRHGHAQAYDDSCYAGLIEEYTCLEYNNALAFLRGIE